MDSNLDSAPERELAPETVAGLVASRLPWLAVVGGLYTILFFPVLRVWAQDCWDSGDHSHCLLVPVLSAALLWRDRARLASLPVRGSWLGAALLLGGLVVFFLGLGIHFNVAMRIGALAVLWGLVGWLLGMRVLTAGAFPLGFLLLALPLPFVLHSGLSRFLKGVATKLAASTLPHMSVPAFNEGNVLHVGDHVLGVVDACSGIRSIMVIVTAAVFMSYLARAGIFGGFLLLVFTLPVTVFVNVLRIVVIASVLFWSGFDMTSGTVHEIVGLVVFLIATAALYASLSFVFWILGKKPPEAASTTPGEVGA